MLSVVIKDDNEPQVTRLTYENLWRELKGIPNTEIIIAKDWFSVLPSIKNIFVCFVEADCLVNSGYFSSQIGLFKKNPLFRKLAMLSSAVAVNQWVTRFYGYSIEKHVIDGYSKLEMPFIEPVKDKKSKNVYPVQIGYLPGAIIRTAMLRSLLEEVDISSRDADLVHLSTEVSLGFWSQGDGNRVHINPNTTYVTTEEYVNDLGDFDPQAGDVIKMFARELI